MFILSAFPPAKSPPRLHCCPFKPPVPQVPCGVRSP
nr:MAG TPA: hypothetical protein [Caudoviricetes sp.]